ncbi:MAG: UDP-glucose/GDP-mannose dehydrogenase family protein [Stygiobacter sp.]|nr:MAG: UDP-glucose/GDP-mannose dehydrogenase family protein [Stygiobacter sp.]
MKVSIIGTGYVGLVTAVGLSDKGHDVIGVDLRRDIVDKINSGNSPIYEVGLEEKLKNVIMSKKLIATTDLEFAITSTDITLIAVGTPNINGKIDLSQVKSISSAIGQCLKTKSSFHSVVLKSTALPGTTKNIIMPLVIKGSNKSPNDIGFGMNPEFLREGNAVKDFFEPDRIIFGVEDERTFELLDRLYEPWVCDKLKVNTKTAEFIKYCSNSIIAAQISLVNELANLGDNIGDIDFLNVIRGVHLDKRWSPIINTNRIQPEILSYHYPGPGFGGSCFPKDLQALVEFGNTNNQPMDILSAVMKTNVRQSEKIINIINNHQVSQNIKTIAILGLAFKPNTDDVRESPAIQIVKGLVKNGYKITVSDPVALKNFLEELKNNEVIGYDKWMDAVKNTDAVIIVTGWDEYKSITPKLLKSLMTGKFIFDCRRILDKEMFTFDFKYHAIGLS